jgi:hypothetical protein
VILLVRAEKPVVALTLRERKSQLAFDDIHLQQRQNACPSGILKLFNDLNAEARMIQWSQANEVQTAQYQNPLALLGWYTRRRFHRAIRTHYSWSCGFLEPAYVPHFFMDPQ